MKRLTGISIIVGVFVLIFVALAYDRSFLAASLVYLCSFTLAAVLMIGVSLAAGEDALAAFRDLLDY